MYLQMAIDEHFGAMIDCRAPISTVRIPRNGFADQTTVHPVQQDDCFGANVRPLAFGMMRKTTIDHSSFRSRNEMPSPPTLRRQLQHR